MIAEHNLHLEHRLTKLETKSDFTQQAIVEIEATLSKYLHSPHTPEIDNLLDKVINHTITLTERARLRELLVEALNNPEIDDLIQIAAGILAGIQGCRQRINI